MQMSKNQSFFRCIVLEYRVQLHRKTRCFVLSFELHFKILICITLFKHLKRPSLFMPFSFDANAFDLHHFRSNVLTPNLTSNLMIKFHKAHRMVFHPVYFSYTVMFCVLSPVQLPNNSGAVPGTSMGKAREIFRV